MRFKIIFIQIFISILLLLLLSTSNFFVYSINNNDKDSIGKNDNNIDLNKKLKYIPDKQRVISDIDKKLLNAAYKGSVTGINN
jgi:hypothetical protein